MNTPKPTQTLRILVQNRKALHNYECLERFDAGLVLVGSEVKAIRESTMHIAQAWVKITDYNEAFLMQAWIPPYSHANIQNHDGTRPKKLLLKKSQLERLSKQLQLKGFTLIPLKLYLKGRLMKLEIALAKGKKFYDKRSDQKEKDAKRDMDLALKQKRLFRD